MATTFENQFVTVQSYANPMLAMLQENNIYTNTANRVMESVTGEPFQLGATWKYKIPFDALAGRGITADFQPTNQLYRTMSVDDYYYAAYGFPLDNYLFNAERFMDDYGKVHMAALGAVVEFDISQIAINTAYLHYGDGLTPITNFPAMARASTQLQQAGSAGRGNANAYISQVASDNIVASGLGEFTPIRNDKMVKKWAVGNYREMDFFAGNLLPIFYAGTAGTEQQTLTIEALVYNSSGGVIGMTLSGATPNDLDAIKANDKGRILDVDVATNPRRVAKYGHIPVQAPVQFRILGDAPADGAGNVDVTITPALQATAGLTQNISKPLQIGMTIKLLPSTQLGMMVQGNALFLNMPDLPEQSPYVSNRAVDPETKVKVLSTYGTIFNSGAQGMIHRVWTGSDADPDYIQALPFKIF